MKMKFGHIYTLQEPRRQAPLAQRRRRPRPQRRRGLRALDVRPALHAGGEGAPLHRQGQGADRQRRLRRQDPRVLPGRHRDRAPRQDALHGPHDAHARPAPRDLRPHEHGSLHRDPAAAHRPQGDRVRGVAAVQPQAEGARLRPQVAPAASRCALHAARAHRPQEAGLRIPDRALATRRAGRLPAAPLQAVALRRARPLPPGGHRPPGRGAHRRQGRPQLPSVDAHQPRNLASPVHRGQVRRRNEGVHRLIAEGLILPHEKKRFTPLHPTRRGATMPAASTGRMVKLADTYA